MKNNYVKYGTIALVILLLGIYVYPTMYRYDKWQQRFPVRINRITGTTEVLNNSMKWELVESADPPKSEVRKIRDEIDQSIRNDHDKIKQEIQEEIESELKTQVEQSADRTIKELQDEIVALKREVELAKLEVSIYKKFETDPNNYFTVGDSKETVKNIMGRPDSISIEEYFNQETWKYGWAYITFKNGKVKEWHDDQNTLRIK